MLDVYICPKCGLVRYVSKDKTLCFRCGVDMIPAGITYADYICLDTEDRQTYIDRIKHHLAL
jgi:tRNA(Ile2) C34 agmatinyltransferase TiaS